MKNRIDKIYRRIRGSTKLERKFPELKDKSQKIHVLFLNCLMNASGMHRMIQPYLALNQTGSHKAIIGSMHKWDFNKDFEDYDNAVDQELIEWADYVVFPPITAPFEPIYRMLKEVNPKIKIVFDFDHLNFAAPTIKSNADLKKKLRNEQGFANLEFADFVSCATPALANYYERITKSLFAKKQLEYAIIPDLISLESFTRMPSRPAKKSDKLRVGIVGTPGIARDFEEPSIQIKDFIKANQKDVQLVMMGWKGTYKNKQLFDDLQREYHRAVPFQRYYETVHALNLDLVLLPHSVSKKYSYGKSLIKLIELSALGIPVLTDHQSKYRKLIDQGETGFIVTENQNWQQSLEHLLVNKAKLDAVGHFAQKFMWKNFSWSSFKTKLLANTYI